MLNYKYSVGDSVWIVLRACTRSDGKEDMYANIEVVKAMIDDYNPSNGMPYYWISNLDGVRYGSFHESVLSKSKKSAIRLAVKRWM